MSYGVVIFPELQDASIDELAPLLRTDFSDVCLDPGQG